MRHRLISQYFDALFSRVQSSPIVNAHNISFDIRGLRVGFIRGIITFIDQSELHVRELVDLAVPNSRVAYAYHYQNLSHQLIFRYDNTPHFPDLSTFPHHKHVDNENNVIESLPLNIFEVLDEIEMLNRWD